VPEGCVGEAMLGVRIEQNEGRIEIHSPAAGLGYWPDAELSILGNGRFIPGDLVEKTPHGYRIHGRVSDVINVAGRKLNPAEVELVLKTHPNVRDAIVFGVPSAMRGEEPVTCVVGDVSPSELIAFAGNRLPSWQVPKDIWIVEAIPVNERGKLNRRALSEQWKRRASG
jgi:acyl-CoA synthetase (AMP-forming)/AMP-acid ligase II